MLARLADAAALAYRHVEAEALRHQIITLRTQPAGLSFDGLQTVPNGSLRSG